jgi:hypothetical protein
VAGDRGASEPFFVRAPGSDGEARGVGGVEVPQGPPESHCPTRHPRCCPVASGGCDQIFRLALQLSPVRAFLAVAPMVCTPAALRRRFSTLNEPLGAWVVRLPEAFTVPS